MVFVSTKGQGPSACYTVACTILLMIVVFALEDALFPAHCSICNLYTRDRIAVFVNFDKNWPLVSRPKSTIDDGDKEVSETTRNVDFFQVDLNNTHGTDKGKKSEVEVLLDGNASLVKTTKKPEEDGDGEQIGRTSSAPAPAPLPPAVSPTWYYAHVYEHPVAELRLLTAEDEAPPLRSNISRPEREITIVTQSSVDRLPALEAICKAWGGAIVAALYVRVQSKFASVYEQVKQMHARVEAQSGCRLDIQLVTEDGYETDEEALRALYPVNALRNVALGMVKTKLVFLLDVDFKPSPRLHESLTEDEGTYQDLLRKATEEKKLFVIPSFGAADVKGGSSVVVIPETMEELRKEWEEKTIDCFHCARSPTGHMPTNFDKFFDPATTSPYPITYKNGFEPYVIGALDVIPPYDARFRGYGKNKVAHLYACAADGMGFIVLPNVFTFELQHPPSPDRKIFRSKRKNRYQMIVLEGLYFQFQDEIQKEQMKKDPARYKKFVRSSKI